MGFLSKKSSQNRADPTTDLQRLEDVMRRRWFSTLQRRQGQINESQLQLNLFMLDSKDGPEGDEGVGSVMSPTAVKPPVSPASPLIVSNDHISRKEHLKEMDRQRTALNTACDERLSRERREDQARRDQEQSERQRKEIVDCGLSGLLGRGEQSDRHVSEFARLARSTAESLRSASGGGLVGQLSTDLESLPIAIVQLLSRRYYDLVRTLRALGGEPIDVRMAHEVGRAFANWIKRVPERPLQIEVMMEGTDFDEALCVPADPARGFGASRKVNPVTFAVGQPGSRTFRKAVVEPEIVGGA